MRRSGSRQDARAQRHPDPLWHAEVTTLLARTDAVVHPVDNGTAGQARFGGLDCFRDLVRHAADNPEPRTYQRHLAEKITHRGLDVTLLTRFHPDIRRMLAHPALRGVVVPSRAEPFGRVPIEAYAAGATPVIATTAGGLTEQIIDGRTGFTATPEDPTSLAAALRRALALTPAGRHRMRDNAWRFAAARYDYPLAVRAFLAQIAPWFHDQPGSSQSR